MTERLEIRKLSTGVPGLDEVLGGGVPELSFNLIAGAPGCGKTTLAHQIVFANATEERRAVYFTVYGEPPIKMLRYQQQFDFFDASKLTGAIRFVHLGQELMEGGLSKVLARIVRELETTEPSIVVVDSFRSLARVSNEVGHRQEQLGVEAFVQRLALMLTSYEATTFLIGEYNELESNNPVFTVADGLVWLHQTVARNSVVRRLQVTKVRGQEQIPGLHTVKISNQGMRVYPRIQKPEERQPRTLEQGEGGPPERRKIGVPGLDEMLGGGIPTGYSLLVVGPSGSGKTMLGTHFLMEGVQQGEPGVLAVFEKRPQDYLRTVGRGRDIQRSIDAAKISLVYIRPLDLSVDETLEEIQRAVSESGATRVVIDSLSGFELALAPTFRDDFRESLYRMVGALTSLGVTVLMTCEVTDSFTEVRLSPHGISFLSDGIILQRYFEIDGEISKAMTVIKMRASSHSKALREYEITENGIVIGDGLTGYRGLLIGESEPAGARWERGKRAAKKSAPPKRAAKKPTAKKPTAKKPTAKTSAPAKRTAKTPRAKQRSS